MKKIIELAQKFGKNKDDTGRSEVQIALFSDRIRTMSEHLTTNKKDNSSRFGLVRLVNKRKKLLRYLAKKDTKRYQAIIKALGLRK
ncbi:30S ribosomal protein S15 [Spirochaetota bacterium]|nr:30S ribosomal protein S15 [Spirochaetota bacterium]